MARIEYKYNGRSFDDFKVVVKASSGVVDLPQMKERQAYDWADMNGHIVDTDSRPQYKERIIELQCSMFAHSAAEFMSQVQDFASIFRHSGKRLLQITLPGLAKPLYFLCYLKSGITITKAWRQEAMYGTFTLQLEEPEPMKSVYLFKGSEDMQVVAKFAQTGDVINVYWTDTDRQLDITGKAGESKATTYDFKEAGDHIVIITGDVEYTEITTNATQLWTLL